MKRSPRLRSGRDLAAQYQRERGPASRQASELLQCLATTAALAAALRIRPRLRQHAKCEEQAAAVAPVAELR